MKRYQRLYIIKYKILLNFIIRNLFYLYADVWDGHAEGTGWSGKTPDGSKTVMTPDGSIWLDHAEGTEWSQC